MRVLWKNLIRKSSSLSVVLTVSVLWSRWWDFGQNQLTSFLSECTALQSIITSQQPTQNICSAFNETGWSQKSCNFVQIVKKFNSSQRSTLKWLAHHCKCCSNIWVIVQVHHILFCYLPLVSFSFSYLYETQKKRTQLSIPAARNNACQRSWALKESLHATCLFYLFM